MNLAISAKFLRITGHRNTSQGVQTAFNNVVVKSNEWNDINHLEKCNMCHAIISITCRDVVCDVQSSSHVGLRKMSCMNREQF